MSYVAYWQCGLTGHGTLWHVALMAELYVVDIWQHLQLFTVWACHLWAWYTVTCCVDGRAVCWYTVTCCFVGRAVRCCYDNICSCLQCGLASPLGMVHCGMLRWWQSCTYALLLCQQMCTWHIETVGSCVDAMGCHCDSRWVHALKEACLCLFHLWMYPIQVCVFFWTRKMWLNSVHAYRLSLLQVPSESKDPV